MRINGGGWLEGLFLEVWDRSRGLNLIEIWGRKIWEKARQDLRPVIAQLGPGEKWLWSIFFTHAKAKDLFWEPFYRCYAHKMLLKLLVSLLVTMMAPHIGLIMEAARQRAGGWSVPGFEWPPPPPTKADQPPLTFPPLLLQLLLFHEYCLLLPILFMCKIFPDNVRKCTSCDKSAYMSLVTYSKKCIIISCDI